MQGDLQGITHSQDLDPLSWIISTPALTPEYAGQPTDQILCE